MRRINRAGLLDLIGRLFAGAAFVAVDWHILGMIRELSPLEQAAIARWLLTAAIAVPGILLAFRDAIPHVVHKLTFVFAMWATLRGLSAYLDSMLSTSAVDTAGLSALTTYGGTALLAALLLFKLRHVLLSGRTAS